MTLWCNGYDALFRVSALHCAFRGGLSLVKAAFIVFLYVGPRTGKCVQLSISIIFDHCKGVEDINLPPSAFVVLPNHTSVVQTLRNHVYFVP